MENKQRTSLIKNERLSEMFNLPNLWIKDEGENTYGTHKDRRSKLILQKAINDRIDKLVLITSGNAGYSLGMLAKEFGIKIICIIDKNLKKSIRRKLDLCSTTVEVDLSKRILKPADTMALARENNDEAILDVTNGFHNAYGELLCEIAEKNPEIIILPLGSGETFVGIYNEIEKLKLKTKLIGVSVKNKWESYADKLCTPYTPYKSKIQSILTKGHKIIYLTEEEVKKAYKRSKRYFNVEPSSSVIFGILSKLNVKKDARIILINSGKGLV